MKLKDGKKAAFEVAGPASEDRRQKETPTELFLAKVAAARAAARAGTAPPVPARVSPVVRGGNIGARG